MIPKEGIVIPKEGDSLEFPVEGSLMSSRSFPYA